MIWSIVCWLLILFFTLLGIAVSIYSVLFHVLIPSGKREYLLLIPAASKCDVVSQIHAAQLRAELLGRRQCSGVFVIADGLDDEAFRQCACACSACGRTRLCTMAELEQHLRQTGVDKEETHAL